MSRMIAIGDVHGNHAGVKKVLDKFNYDPTIDKVLFVGDYIDYLSSYIISIDANSKKTISLLIKLKAENNNVHCIIGNHDLWFRNWIFSENAIAPSIWYHQGGKYTLSSYGITSQLPFNVVKNYIPKDHIDFLNTLLPFYIDDNIISMHGGFKTIQNMNDVNLNNINFSTLEEIVWDRKFYITNNKNMLSEYKKIFGNRLFICGHTPYGYKESTNPHRICIDAGSCGGGRLLGVEIDLNTMSIVNQVKV